MAEDRLQVRNAGAAALVEKAQPLDKPERVEDLVAQTLSQLHSALDTSQVVGEPIRLGDTTIIPLLSVGIGFGAGRGNANVSGKSGGHVGVGAGGGGMRPIALVIAGPDGVRVEPVANPASLDKLVGALERKLSPGDAPKEK